MNPSSHKILVIACRAAVGATFVVSGWAKAVDPYGFLYKLMEYLSVWHIGIPREIVLIFAVALAAMEFTVGMCLMLGCLRRSTPIFAALIMAVMLPLTVYIAVAEPVSDCGCFGDLWVISNTATLGKNVVLAVAVVYLLCCNTRIRGLFYPEIQWMVIVVTVAYPLVLSFIGYNIQPVVDFRPYKVGTSIVADGEDEESAPEYLYEKEGRTERFSLDELPDSTWTFVGTDYDNTEGHTDVAFAIFDGDEEVTYDVIGDRDDLLLLLIPEPDIQFLARGRYANEIAEYAEAHECGFFGVLGASKAECSDWLTVVRPRFPVYTAEDTSIKQVARGDAALVFVSDGIIKWKRNLSSFDLDLSVTDYNILESVEPVDDGRFSARLLASYAVLLIGIYLLNLSPRILRLFVRGNSKKNC